MIVGPYVAKQFLARIEELKEQLDEANERIAELEHELRVAYDDPGYTISEGVIVDGS